MALTCILGTRGDHLGIDDEPEIADSASQAAMAQTVARAYSEARRTEAASDRGEIRADFQLGRWFSAVST
jgi:hypothetical protein